MFTFLRALWNFHYHGTLEAKILDQEWNAFDWPKQASARVKL